MEMAQKVRTLFIDDIDGSEAEGTVGFGLDGAHYEIDLSQVHARELRAILARYAASRPQGHRNHRAPGPPAGQGRRGRPEHHGDTRLGAGQRAGGQGPRPDPGRRGRGVPGRHRAVAPVAAVPAPGR